MRFRRAVALMMLAVLPVSTGCTPKEQQMFIRAVAFYVVVCGVPVDLAHPCPLFGNFSFSL